MDKKKHEMLTASELTASMTGFVFGAGVLLLPTLLVKTAYQDAWISAIIALIYPLYIILISSYIAKRHPKDNILNISRKYFGKVFGNILNGIFGLQFFIYIGTVLADFDITVRTFIVGFLTPTKVIIFCLGIAAIAASKGIKVFGKTVQVINILIVLIIILTLFIFKDGSLGNFKPVFEAGTANIIKASKDAVYSYLGFEGLTLIHPSVRSGANIKAASLKALAFCSIIWVWSVAASIIFLGADIIPKSLWSFTLVYNSINFPIINNLRYIFMFIWSLSLFNLLTGYIFLSHTVIYDLVRIKMTKVFYVTLPLLAFYTFIITNDLIKLKLIAIISPFFACFNIIFLSTVMLITKFKKKSTSRG